MEGYKVYVDVMAVFTKEGVMTPKSIVWTDGHRYEIQKVTDIRRAASLRAGGVGMKCCLRAAAVYPGDMMPS